MPDDKSDRTMPEEEIDETLAETFPASDPPSWTVGVDPHRRESDVSADKKDDKATKETRVK